MKRVIIKKVILVALCCFLIASCATPVQILKDASRPSKPEWIERNRSDGDALYFVGIATDAPTLEEGEDAALKAAVAKAASYIGVKIDSQFVEHTTEASTEINKKLVAKSSASVASAKTVDAYHEKLTRVEGDYRIEKYTVYILISVEKSFADKERKRQQEEKRNKVELAYHLFIEASDKIGQKDYPGAKTALLSAKNNLDKVEDSIALDNSEKIKTSGELENEVSTALGKVIQAMRRISIFARTNDGDEGNKVFSSNIAMVMTKRGFVVVQEGDAYVSLKASAKVTKKGIVMGMNAYSIVGDVVGINTRNGNVEVTIAFDTTGFHANENNAILNAISEGAMTAGEKVATELIKKEEVAGN